MILFHKMHVPCAALACAGHVVCAIICNVVTHDSDVELYSSNQPV